MNVILQYCVNSKSLFYIDSTAINCKYNPSINKFGNHPRAFKFSATLFNFKLRDADTVLGEKNSDPEIDDKMKTGFTNFLKCLDLYLDLQSNVTSVNENVEVHIYKSVTLENGIIIRATNKYYGKSWFSDISVRMNSDELFDYASNEGICYGQVIV